MEEAVQQPDRAQYQQDDEAPADRHAAGVPLACELDHLLVLLQMILHDGFAFRKLALRLVITGKPLAVRFDDVLDGGRLERQGGPGSLGDLSRDAV